MMKSLHAGWVIVVSTVLGSSFGCSAPLGTTKYPAAVLDSVEGSWLLDHLPSDDESDRDLALTASIERQPATDRSSSPAIEELLFGQRVDEERPRYSVAIQLDDEDEREVVIEGEFIQAHDKTIFTFQGSPEATGWPFDFLVTPLQYTVLIRLDEEGEEQTMTVYMPEPLLLWNPIPVQRAGSIRRDVPERLLVGSLDHILDYYFRNSDVTWTPVFTATRNFNVGP
jgi:hypothetical protein